MNPVTRSILSLALSLLLVSCSGETEITPDIELPPTAIVEPQTPVPQSTTSSQTTPEATVTDLSVDLSPVSPVRRVFPLGALADVADYSIEGHADQIRVRLYSPDVPELDFSFDHGDDPGEIDFSGVPPGNYELFLEISDSSSNEYDLVELQPIAITERIPDAGADLLWGVNLGDPRIRGFDSFAEKVAVFQAINPGIVIRLNFDVELYGLEPAEYRELIAAINHPILIVDKVFSGSERFYVDSLSKALRSEAFQHVVAVEILNEPNHSDLDVSDVLRTLAFAHAATKLVDATMPVILTSMANRDYLMYADVFADETSRTCHQFDWVSLHDFRSQPPFGTDEWAETLRLVPETVQELQAVISEYCDGWKPPVALTEFPQSAHWRIAGEHGQFNDDPESGIEFYAQWYLEMWQAYRSESAVVIALLHEWEYVDNFYLMSEVLEAAVKKISEETQGS